MSVLLVTGIHPPDVGGPATYIPKLAETMTTQGIEVEVLTLRDRHVSSLAFAYRVHSVVREGLLIVRMIKVIGLTITRLRRVEAVMANGLHQEVAIALCFVKVRSLAKIVGDPVWERARNRGETKCELTDFAVFSKLSLRQKAERLFLVWSLNRYNLVVCPSKELKNLVQSWGVKTEVLFIPNGIKQTNHVSAPKEFDVCSASRLVQWKNIDKIIDACGIVGATLAIAGDGPEYQALNQKVSNGNNQVKFFGQLNDAEVTELVNKSRIFVLFSDYEGLSFSLLKAMSLGAPIIISDATGNVQVLENLRDCLVVPKHDTLKLSEAISKLLADEDLARKLGVAARTKAEAQYSEAALLNQVIDLLKVPA